MKIKIDKFTTKHAPEFISVVVSGLVAGLLASGSFTIFFSTDEQLDGSSYEQQIDTLNGVVESIDTLKIFVDNQKDSLEKAQMTLLGLQEQQDILKPVLEANQQTVDAIFAIQAQKERTNVWLERAIGFFLGIAGSLIASLIWAYFKDGKEQAIGRKP